MVADCPNKSKRLKNGFNGEVDRPRVGAWGAGDDGDAIEALRPRGGVPVAGESESFRRSKGLNAKIVGVPGSLLG